MTRPNRALIRSGSPYEDAYGFSRGVRIHDEGGGTWVHIAGTAPIWPDNACDPNPEVQARRCLEIICDALAQAGCSADDVVRTRMYITDPACADAVGQVHGEVFVRARPAATMVVVAALLDPRWKVEIEAEAFRAR